MSDTLIETVNLFLGTFISAMPFLLLGALAAGLIDVLLPPEAIRRSLPQSAPGVVAAGLLAGFALPVTEYGIVPLAHRLEQRGLPPAATVTLLVGGATFNPIVLAATYRVFGWGWVLAARVGVGVLLAIGMGALYSIPAAPAALFNPPDATVPARPQAAGSALQHALRGASGMVVRFGPLLVLGAALSAVFRMAAPLSAWVGLSTHPAGQIALAVVGSVLSGQHALAETLQIAASGRALSAGALAAFLAMGTAADLSTLLLLAPVMRRRQLAYLAIMLALGAVLAGLLVQLIGVGG